MMTQKLLQIAALSLFALPGLAQTYNMPTGAGLASTATTCSGTFRDNGGAANYSNSQNSSYTFYPSTAGQYVTVTFTAFSTQLTSDYLAVYDGPGGPLIAQYSGTPSTPFTVTASSANATHGLTFRFRSNANTVSTGFQATIACTATPGAIPAFTPNAQDCQQGGGMTICNNSNLTANSSGSGTVNDLANPWDGCLSGGENQSSWYYFSPSSSGTLGFTIAPANGLDDYDFALWGPFTTVTCPANVSLPPLRCSYSGLGGNTGCGNGAVDVSEGALGDKWVSTFPVIAGEIYVLVIDNFLSSSNPFTLTWSLGGGASLDCTVLPVEFTVFDGERIGESHHLHWETASELNNDYFVVERSLNGEPFTEIGRVDGSGHSSQMISYPFEDTNPGAGVNYYRIRQVDFNGQSRYTYVIALNYETPAAVYVDNVHPQPTDGDVYFDFYSPEETEISYVITDIAGRVVAEQNVKTGAGKNTIYTHIEDANTGIYTLRVIDQRSGTVSVSRLVKY